MPNLKIEFIPIDNKIFTSRNIKPFVPAAPYETYFKLLATDILEKEEERVLCLDTDAICVGNLEDIYFRDFGDSLIMGGYDVGINEDNYDTIVPEYYLNFSKIGITPFSYSEYVNCGGVLFNLANMRKLGKESDFLLEFASKYSEFGVVDQGVLNAAFHGQVSHFIVSESINVMFGEEVSTRKLLLSKDSKTILVQGIFTAKPWNMTRSFALGKKFWSIYDEYLNEVGALSFVYSWSNLKKFGLENRIVSLILPYCIMISLQKFLLLKKNGHKMSPECWQQSKR
jgi:lipopolysaccharide biosynthesis glycosyltransferase